MTDRHTVVVVAAEDDLTADLVVKHLGDHAAPVVRVDPLHLEHPVTTGHFGTGGWRTTLRAGDRTLALGPGTAVYWRKPRRPDQCDEADQQWLADENTTALLGLLRAQPLRIWVNDPHANEVARLKPLQLAIAAQCGFEVPASLLTNDPDQARAFVEEHQQVVLKTLTQRYTTLIPASLVTPADDLSGTAGCLHQFQQLVDKVSDVRVTVIGEQFFGCAITSAAGDLDWRATDRDQIRYEVIATPRPVRKACTDYMRALSLRYAAFDFALDRDGRWHWLEANPNGEFGFVEAATGMPIAEALAEYLSEHTPRRR